MSTQINKISVRALVAYTRDVGKNIARIDQMTMEALGVSKGGFLEVQGQRTTASKCMPLYPMDVNKGITRIDGLIRDNAGLAIGDTVWLRKIEPVLAQSLVLVPSEKETRIDEEYIADAMSGTPLALGDKILIPFGLEWRIFLSLDAQPHADVLLVGNETHIELVPSIF